MIFLIGKVLGFQLLTINVHCRNDTGNFKDHQVNSYETKEVAYAHLHTGCKYKLTLPILHIASLLALVMNEVDYTIL